jgi:hypothetical protein
MRISISVNDRGYISEAMWCQVVFNGKPAAFVQTADDEEGKIWYHSHEGELTDEIGKLVHDDLGNRILKEASGEVRIVYCKAAFIKVGHAKASYGEKCIKCGATEDTGCLNTAMQQETLKLLRSFA